jgi:hypothetical protein
MIDVHGRQKFFINFPADLRDDWQKGDDPFAYEKPETFKANSYASNLSDDQWKVVSVRQSTKGNIQVDIHEQNVYIWDEKEPCPKRWKLVITRDHATKKDIKYSLTNAPEFTTNSRLAYMQRQRYWVEHSFGVMKGTCGLSDYQVRSWTGWHHHAAMVLLANLFICQEQLDAPEGCELLSGNDVRELLQHFLPNKKQDEDEIFRQLKHRHWQRERAISQAFKIKEPKIAFDIANVPK